MYGETVLFDAQEITHHKNGEPSMCQYLRAMHEDEWDNLIERLGITTSRAEEVLESESNNEEERHLNLEMRLWASLRGQTLARTVHGVMQYEVALRMFSLQERTNCVHVTAHRYGKSILPQSELLARHIFASML